jgi:DNA polymerase III subunit epsilon
MDMIFHRLIKSARSTPLADQKFCAVDVETTGLDLKSDEILAFACVPIQRSRILVHEAYYTLIRPEAYRIDAMKYHGISPKDLEKAPFFADVADQIFGMLDGIILGHSVHYDHEFLKRHFKKGGLNLKREMLDVALVERWLARKTGLPGQDETFEAIMRRYGLRDCYRHNALADAFFAAQIFQLQMARLERQGITTVEQLRKALKNCRYAAW